MSRELWQVEFLVDAAAANRISDALEEVALATEWHEQEMDSDVWVFQALFDFPITEDELANYLPNDIQLHGVQIETMPDADWLQASYRSFPPIEIGRFYIYGTHLSEAAPSHMLPIKLNAATAFGSGEHATTRGCLEAIDKLANDNKFKSPLDLGCGAGILAMAAAKALQTTVLAVDNDPEAVRVTESNAELNGLTGLVEAKLSNGFDEIGDKKFDLILANILANPLRNMAPVIVDRLASDGVVVLSGFLNHQAAEVIGSYTSLGCSIIEENKIGNWTTAVLKRG